MLRSIVLVVIVLCFSACQTQPKLNLQSADAMAACQNSKRVGATATLLKRIYGRQYLRLVTLNGATSYYLDQNNQQAGLEYELARKFSNYLGVKLHITTVGSYRQMVEYLRHGQADIAAASLVVSPQRRRELRFGPAYQYVSPLVIYRRGMPQPRTLGDLHPGSIAISALQPHAEYLQSLTPIVTGGVVRPVTVEGTSEDLMALVWHKKMDYTVVNSHEWLLTRHGFPELRAAFPVANPQPVAWAMPNGCDHSLAGKISRFFKIINKNKELAQLLERYFGHVNQFDYVGTVKFIQHIKGRLPAYRGLFEETARNQQLDWRLLASIAYQESHWDPKAVSPTGVRGLMMLTQKTATDLELNNRTDPKQSVYGGAVYFRQLMKRLPKAIVGPDRSWMALAAYNVGYGHLMDARAITRKRGGNANKWIDVKMNFPLLTQREWYKKTRNGYARGHEPVVYVENIRRYLHSLIYFTDEKQNQRLNTYAKVSLQNP